jgi:hypothetical protein
MARPARSWFHAGIETPDLVRLARARDLAASGRAAQLQERAQLSDRLVGDATRVSHVTVGRWRRGERRPSGPGALRWLRLFERLEAAFGDDEVKTA